MVNKSPEQEASRVETRSREVFDDSVTNLDARTRSRLNEARHAALDAARAPQNFSMRWLLPVGSAAALALIVVVAVQMTRTPSAVITSAATVEDIEIMTSPDSLELIEDADFYASLDSGDDATPAAGTDSSERG
jgi:hypothetical protein